MKFLLYVFLFSLFFLILLINESAAEEKQDEKDIFDFTLNSIDGDPVPLMRFKGKVILLVNVASKCGLTPQYEGLQKLYSKYKDRDFIILGFPANNFLKQEPGTDKEIKSFCSVNYGVEFPIFSKISVKGKNQHPLYKFLTSKETNPLFPGKIRWNFEKFIFNRNGEMTGRFHPKVKPDDKQIIELIEKELSR